jgi:hypothetical protein
MSAKFFLIIGSPSGAVSKKLSAISIQLILLKNSYSALGRHSAETEIQFFQCLLDSRLRGPDGKLGLFRLL